MAVGPFESRPGDWHSLGIVYDELLQPSDRVVAFTADSVSAGGEPVGYPPLHMHHVHVMRGTAVSTSREAGGLW